MRLIEVRTLALVSAVALAACSSGGDTGNQGAGTQGKAAGKGDGGQPPQVGYVVVQQTRVPLMTELPGRTFAYQSSEVRPQVSGVIQKRLFKEGSLVRQGQPLYQIDPSLYRAAVNEASAAVQSAQATAAAARVRAERFRPLAEIEAVSKQDYTDAVATQRQAEASIAQNRAQLETARVNLRFTTVPAPITGRIGRSLFTVGALVTTSQADPLATIQQLDPIYVDIQQSAADLLRLRRQLASGGALPASAAVRLKLEDGSDYGRTGFVEFSEVVVDQQTGTVTMRARFPNPDGLLLPGMFVRAVFAQAIEANAFLVPQQAVARDPQGNATVWVVDANNKAVQRTVQTVRADGANWIVTGGLNPGDRVITQGTARLSPNSTVRPVPASAPQQPKPPTPEQLKQQQKAKGG
ncbi:efflux RND transporter periplasmic adaptor subunit [Sphingomonas sp. ABOLG]|jgi:membrane fusion protein (multidrug efflux system)|uniref:Efflux RND transporter periplasmic adaptor subunit n=1 Tax=Sphingomonas olei TaxID=1886787 RepID=A0ABY2QET2_9SPHN|nr:MULTISPECIES: efflux RND transporter periplasmic adaptor subunit [Sphingomonas]MDF2603860.1 efflux transporter periplasmic adaptor subunit [Sphingomonas sp.]RSV19876.1 efflux RND transporter periplasmic adaptor subunit [Sphingomonas sp. ABOLG]THG38602.1 efflux RND transporter periplasmic adaptor subunit [Sphingomonas olei]